MKIEEGKQVLALQALFNILHTFAWGSIGAAGSNSPRPGKCYLDPRDAQAVLERLQEVGLELSANSTEWEQLAPYAHKGGQGFQPR